jgi:putative addiction module antidote
VRRMKKLDALPLPVRKQATVGARVPAKKRDTGKPMQVTITTIGTSAGIILPKAALQQLHAEKGQKLFVTEAPGGGLRISRFDPEFERQMRYAYEAMDRFPDALKELAK